MLGRTGFRFFHAIERNKGKILGLATGFGLGAISGGLFMHRIDKQNQRRDEGIRKDTEASMEWGEPRKHGIKP